MKKTARIVTVAAVWLLSLLIVGVTVRNLRTEQYRSEAAKHLQQELLHVCHQGSLLLADEANVDAAAVAQLFCEMDAVRSVTVDLYRPENPGMSSTGQNSVWRSCADALTGTGNKAPTMYPELKEILGSCVPPLNEAPLSVQQLDAFLTELEAKLEAWHHSAAQLAV